MQIHSFYKGLTSTTGKLINASTKRGSNKNNENEAYELLEDMARNNSLWPSERLPPPKKVTGIHEVDVITKLTA